MEADFGTELGVFGLEGVGEGAELDDGLKAMGRGERGSSGE
jgi:hypothetical protein